MLDEVTLMELGESRLPMVWFLCVRWWFCGARHPVRRLRRCWSWACRGIVLPSLSCGDPPGALSTSLAGFPFPFGCPDCLSSASFTEFPQRDLVCFPIWARFSQISPPSPSFFFWCCRLGQTVFFAVLSFLGAHTRRGATYLASTHVRSACACVCASRAFPLLAPRSFPHSPLRRAHIDG